MFKDAVVPGGRPEIIVLSSFTLSKHIECIVWALSKSLIEATGVRRLGSQSREIGPRSDTTFACAKVCNACAAKRHDINTNRNSVH